MTAFNLMTIAFFLAMLNWFFMYRNYREKCKENEFLYKMLRMHGRTVNEAIEMAQKGKQNDQTNK